MYLRGGGGRKTEGIGAGGGAGIQQQNKESHLLEPSRGKKIKGLKDI